jgi:hypothetical protein
VTAAAVVANITGAALVDIAARAAKENLMAALGLAPQDRAAAAAAAQGILLLTATGAQAAAAAWVF